MTLLNPTNSKSAIQVSFIMSVY